jgi:two-component system, LuxR family, response regulator FixJ
MAFLRDVHPERNGCLIVEVNLAGLNGLDLLHELHQRDIVIPAIITTSGKATESLRSAADSIGATLLEKPFAVGALVAGVRRALARG